MTKTYDNPCERNTQCLSSCQGSRRLAMVALDDAVDLLFTAELAMSLWLECFVEHVVVHADGNAQLIQFANDSTVSLAKIFLSQA